MCLIVGILTFLYMAIGKRYLRYRITGASFQRVIVEDDTLFKGKHVYLLRFNTKLCDKELTFMSPALEPGLYGCADTVKCISVTDFRGSEIVFAQEQKRFFYIDMQVVDHDTLKFDYTHMISGKPFPELVKDINQDEDDGVTFYMRYSRYYYLIDEKDALPKRMKVYLGDRVLDGVVNNNPIIIRIDTCRFGGTEGNRRGFGGTDTVLKTKLLGRKL